MANKNSKNSCATKVRKQSVSARPAQSTTHKQSPAKPKKKTMYASGVVIDGLTWTEKKDGNLMGTCTYNWHDARLWATKAAAKANSERIAKCFRGQKAKPFITAISIEV